MLFFPSAGMQVNIRGQCNKNTTVNNCINFNPTFSRIKMMQ
jgi:hypothetical protein